ncbi:hypothetical protein CHS0354_037943, partial [Potamilus streckersoni]
MYSEVEFYQNCWSDVLHASHFTVAKKHHLDQAVQQTSPPTRCLPLQNSKATTPGPGNATQQPSKSVWCFCQKEEYGQMVACDNQTCQFQWFHFDCKSIVSKPKRELL